MTTKHTATLPDGSTATRTSKSRIYSHCIAVRDTYEGALASAKGWLEADRNSYAFAIRCASVQPGEKYPRPGFNFPVDEKMHAEGVAVEAAFPHFDDYRAAKLAERLAKVEADKAAGAFERWGAAGWASRLDLADKAANQWRNDELGRWEVRIVPAVHN